MWNVEQGKASLQQACPGTFTLPCLGRVLCLLSVCATQFERMGLHDERGNFF